MKFLTIVRGNFKTTRVFVVIVRYVSVAEDQYTHKYTLICDKHLSV